MDENAKSLNAEVRRLDTTDEMQGLALFLASPAASYVTGSQMVIDGRVLPVSPTSYDGINRYSDVRTSCFRRPGF
jgi:hypothetical protein